MHEGAIVSSLFQIALEIKEKEKLKNISLIKVTMGKFHQIVPEVMEMHFNIMKKEYKGFEDAELEMEEKDLIISCPNCGKKTKLTEPLFICPECGSIETDIIQGNELYIASMEGYRDQEIKET